MSRLFTLLIVSIVCAACVNPLAMLDNGDYRRAYEISKRQIDRRLERGKPAKAEQAIALHGSYCQWQDDLDAQVDRHAKIGAPERWLVLYPLYQQKLTLRQDMHAYQEVLPDLVFQYDIESLVQLTERARQSAADYCYEQAAALFDPARKGAKLAAREAHHWLGRSLEYTPERQQYRPLVAEMYDLGTVRVQVSPLLSDGFWATSRMADYFNQRGQSHWRRDWLVIVRGSTTARVDYYADLYTLGAQVSRDIENRDRECFTREVENGYEIIEKKVKKGDTTVVVEERRPIIIEVHGCITRVRQYKEASGAMEVRLSAANGQERPYSWRLYADEDWSNEFEICKGDQRALPETCSGSCRSFPSDGSMLCDLADELRGDLCSTLLRHFPDTQLSRQERREARRLSGQ